MERLSMSDLDVDPEVYEDIERLKLGRRRKHYNLKASTMRRRQACRSTHLTMMHDEHASPPQLPHELPEVVLAGRANVGKSSLMNALCGVVPKDGAASISPKPGWTKSIGFYELVEWTSEEPMMILVDLPGYGPTVSAGAAHGGMRQGRANWSRLTKRYLTGRDELVAAFVLVESALGLQADDHAFMERLERLEVPFSVIMTKADQLEPEQLARSNMLVRQELRERHRSYANEAHFVPMCSAKNCTGILELWERLKIGVGIGRFDADAANGDNDELATSATLEPR